MISGFLGKLLLIHGHSADVYISHSSTKHEKSRVTACFCCLLSQSYLLLQFLSSLSPSLPSFWLYHHNLFFLIHRSNTLTDSGVTLQGKHFCFLVLLGLSLTLGDIHNTFTSPLYYDQFLSIYLFPIIHMWLLFLS